jgi:hypothetical protein
MSRGRIIDATWPIVVLVMPQRFDEALVQTLDLDFAKIFARKQRFALITDSRPVVELPKARERKMITDWASRPDQVVNQKTWNAGSSTIVQNALFRTVLQGFYWVWTPGSPQHAARDVDDAFTWCVQLLEKEKIPLSMTEAAMREILRREMARSGSNRPPAP